MYFLVKELYDAQMFHYSSKRLLFSEVEAIFNLSLMNVLEFNDHKNNISRFCQG